MYTEPAFNGEISSENPEVISLLLATPFHLYTCMYTEHNILYSFIYVMWRCLCRRWRKTFFGTNSNKQICAIVFMYESGETYNYMQNGLCWKMLTENSFPLFSFFFCLQETKHLTWRFPLFYVILKCILSVTCMLRAYLLRHEIGNWFRRPIVFYFIGGLSDFLLQKQSKINK